MDLDHKTNRCGSGRRWAPVSIVIPERLPDFVATQRDEEGEMRHVRVLCVVLVCALVPISQAGATVLEQLELGDLVHRSDKIFRGTVIDVEQGSMSVGGGEIPVVTYRLRVEDSLKGGADVDKGDDGYVEIRMVGSIKDDSSSDGLKHISIFRDIPKLQMGSDYLLFTTPPSSIGLSTTVGLGQGAFSVYSDDKELLAVNQFGNAGLGMDGAGAVPYADLAAEIKGLMGR
jgi:hypothetical protein